MAKTRKEVAQAYAKAKTSHSAFPMGQKFGLATAVLKTRWFINLHNAAAVNIPEADELNEVWEFEHPTRPEPYDETKLPAGLTAQQRDTKRKKQEAVRNDEIVQYDVFEAHETYYKDAMVKAYTVNSMLEHLNEQCLARWRSQRREKS